MPEVQLPIPPKYRYATITVVHSALNVEKVIDFDTNIAYSKIVGMRVLGTDSANFNGGLKINNDEIFPEGFSYALLQSDITVSPDQRFYSVNLKANGAKITGKSTVTVGSLTQKIELKYLV